MKIGSNKGTMILERVVKPQPEPVTIEQMELKHVLGYFEEINPGSSMVLLFYWQEMGVFDSGAEVVYLPVPGEDEVELVDMRNFLLNEYPNFENIEFIVGDING